MRFFNINFYDKVEKKCFLFLCIFILSVIVNFTAKIFIPVIGVMKSLQLTFLIEFIFGVVVFIYFFAKAEFISAVKIKIASVALCILLLIQFAAYSIRAHEAGFMTITRDNILTILMMVLIAPFFEEVFYRGCLLGFLKPLASDIVFPIMATSVLFSLMHMQYNSLTDHFILFLYLYSMSG